MALRILLEAQIELADAICVNNVDLADDEQLEEVERTVREMNEAAPIVRVSATGPVSDNDLDVLLGDV